MYFITHTWGNRGRMAQHESGRKTFQVLPFLIHPFFGIRGSGVETIR